jgi:poly-gamma-glutamate synthesis protein (capsule biosynthesis protein)
MHWGTVEYLTEPEDLEVQFAHDMADRGCDLIVGGHAHILQRMEFYHDVPIFYSMGNFCYGGNLNPDDKDTIIVQAQYSRDSESGSVSRTDLKVIPCLISTRTDKNDYCPTPCAEGSDDYNRILTRLQWTAGL